MFNCHCHIFDLSAVRSEETVRILTQRATRYLRGDQRRLLEERLERLITAQAARKSGWRRASSWPDARQVPREFLRATESGPGLRRPSALSRARSGLLALGWSGTLSLLGRVLPWVPGSSALAELATGVPRRSWLVALSKALGLGSELLDLSLSVKDLEDQPYRTEVGQVLAFVLILLLCSSEDLAGALLRSMGPGSVILPSMMDISTEDDQVDTLDEQASAMLDAIQRYPGRVLPFWAVNTRRDGHLQQLEERLSSGAFVGVKLYPVIERRFHEEKLLRVAELAAELDAPVLTHCMLDGFQSGEPYEQGEHPSHPSKWIRILKEVPTLRLCFGHFGGDYSLARLRLTEAGELLEHAENWSRQILALMEDNPGRVFTDLAFHPGPLQWASRSSQRELARRYWATLRTLLGRSPCRESLLWGTDFTIDRLLVNEGELVSSFRRELNRARSGDFQRVSDTNARRWLKLGERPARELPENLARHDAFLRRETGQRLRL